MNVRKRRRSFEIGRFRYAARRAETRRNVSTDVRDRRLNCDTSMADEGPMDGRELGHWGNAQRTLSLNTHTHTHVRGLRAPQGLVPIGRVLIGSRDIVTYDNYGFSVKFRIIGYTLI